MQCGGHHSRTHALSPLRQNAEQYAIYCDYDDGFGSLVDVTHAEDHTGKNYAGRRAANPSDELFLQVATKNGLFTNSRGHGQRDPSSYLRETFRGKKS